MGHGEDGEETGPKGSGGGYGKPPQATKWQKGQSGNLKGRPKGALNLKTVIVKTAKSRVSIAINGKAKKMSALEAQVEVTKLRALQGKGRSEAEMLAMYRDYLPAENEVAAPTITADEIATLQNYTKLQMLLGEADACLPAPGSDQHDGLGGVASSPKK